MVEDVCGGRRCMGCGIWLKIGKVDEIYNTGGLHTRGNALARSDTYAQV
jgi:hypothetical protein